MKHLVVILRGNIKYYIVQDFSMRCKSLKKIVVFSFFLLVIGATESLGYGVLTHKAIIDVAWKTSLEPALKKKYPQATAEDLHKAYAHAYGGAIIQDMGYFPFGNTFFTDLTHYVRTGDFIQVLLSEAQTIDEYAFALGAMAHYYADNYGHPIGTNRAVPLVYPELMAKFGKTVTYEQDPVAHVKMEFGFDVVQVARGNYAPQAYRDFIGFEVSKELLERAFLKTYGIELKSLFLSLKLTITTFRKSVSGLIPDLTKAAWNTKASQIQAAQPSITRRKFQYRLSNAEFHKNWGREYERPTFFQRVLSWILRLLPKIGPNKTLAFIPPTPEAEKVFMESFNATSTNYQKAIANVMKGKSPLENTDLDTGDATKLGAYEKTDETYVELLERLEKDDFKQINPSLRENILSFFATKNMPKKVKEVDEDDLEDTVKRLEKLKAL